MQIAKRPAWAPITSPRSKLAFERAGVAPVRMNACARLSE